MEIFHPLIEQNLELMRSAQMNHKKLKNMKYSVCLEQSPEYSINAI